MDESYERVYALKYFWDGPRSGVADFGGRPHAFDSLFDEALDDWADEYVLEPIDEPTLTRVIAAWRELEESEAMNCERTPGTPDASVRRQEALELTKALWETIRPNLQTALRSQGSFRGPRPQGPFEVRWIHATAP